MRNIQVVIKSAKASTLSRFTRSFSESGGGGSITYSGGQATQGQVIIY